MATEVSPRDVKKENEQYVKQLCLAAQILLKSSEELIGKDIANDEVDIHIHLELGKYPDIKVSKDIRGCIVNKDYEKDVTLLEEKKAELEAYKKWKLERGLM